MFQMQQFYVLSEKDDDIRLTIDPPYNDGIIMSFEIIMSFDKKGSRYRMGDVLSTDEVLAIAQNAKLKEFIIFNLDILSGIK